MRTYTEREVKTISAWMHDAAARLEIYGPFILTCSTMNSTTRQGSGERVGGGEVSDPTGTTATGNVMTNAWMDREQAIFWSDVGHALDIAQAIVERSGRIYSHVAPVQFLPTDPDRECRQGCGAPRDAGRQGNCKLCAQWLDRNKYPDGMKRDSVPADVIQRRHDVQAKRRMKQQDIEAVA